MSRMRIDRWSARHDSTKETDRLTLTWLTIYATGRVLPFNAAPIALYVSLVALLRLFQALQLLYLDLWFILSWILFTAVRDRVRAHNYLCTFTQARSGCSLSFFTRYRTEMWFSTIRSLLSSSPIRFYGRGTRVSVNWRLRQPIKHIDPTGLLRIERRKFIFYCVYEFELLFRWN